MYRLITLEEPTKQIDIEAQGTGYHHSQNFNQDNPKVQILTVEHDDSLWPSMVRGSNGYFWSVTSTGDLCVAPTTTG